MKERVFSCCAKKEEERFLIWILLYNPFVWLKMRVGKIPKVIFSNPSLIPK